MVDSMRQFSRWLAVFCVMISVMALWIPVHADEVQKKLINFQGYLTNNNAPPTPLDGNYTLTFRIYGTATGGEHLWLEKHEGVNAVAVHYGNLSVLLGSITDMNLAFDSPLYLGIQVGNDLEMMPRQRILPSFQATSANKVNVTYADGSKAEFDAGRLVPIGLISAYFGDPATLPANWKVCDGSVVNDPESPLNGKTLPDLRDRL